MIHPTDRLQEQPEAEQDADRSGHEEGQSPGGGGEAGGQPPADMLANNPLSAGSLLQLVAPVKLRPFRSAYHVRQGNQLRLLCQVQRGLPAAQVSWYVGNRLVDGDFLRDRREFRVLQLRGQEQEQRAPSVWSSVSQGQQQAAEASNQQDSGRLVEINPIPAGRQQMQLTSNGQWVEFRELANEKYAIETPEQQLRYLQMKLGQLGGGSPPSPTSPAGSNSGSSLSGQASLSMLVVNNVQAERHTSRYACRATGRANTDEVTTVVRVKGE